jgi:hypothetical protein
MFSSHTKFKVADGAKVKFWHDLWCEDKDEGTFPDLYGIAYENDAFAAAHLELYGSSNQ